MEKEHGKMKEEIIELRKMILRLSQLPDDLKSLKELVQEKYAQGAPTPNIPIIQQLGPSRGTKASGHARKSIHDPTFSFESKITTVAKNVNNNIL